MSPDRPHVLPTGDLSHFFTWVGFGSLDAMVAVHCTADVDELWIGTRGGDVARWRRGRWSCWSRWSQPAGLTDLRVEHLALGAVGDSVTAAAATADGALVLIGDRWRPVGPRIRTARVLRTRVGKNFETWIGALSGELSRVADGGPSQLVDISARPRGSRTQVLTAIDHGTGSPTIYAGLRSGTLLRFRVGIAGRLVLPRSMVGHPVSALARQTDAGGIMVVDARDWRDSTARSEHAADVG